MVSTRAGPGPWGPNTGTGSSLNFSINITDEWLPIPSVSHTLAHGGWLHQCWMDNITLNIGILTQNIHPCS